MFPAERSAERVRRACADVERRSVLMEAGGLGCGLLPPSVEGDELLTDLLCLVYATKRVQNS